jgi:hypothetical protein
MCCAEDLDALLPDMSRQDRQDRQADQKNFSSAFGRGDAFAFPSAFSLQPSFFGSLFDVTGDRVAIAA